MPCPLFTPFRPLGDVNPGATPLGDLFGGQCAGDLSYVIPSALLRTGCNFGYAREECPLAAQIPDDATTLILGRGEANTVVVRWSLERDHHPVAVGEMDPAQPVSGPLEAQAAAYFSVYQRRRLP